MSASAILLSRIVDYAGLFPPASLGMDAAVRTYQEALAGDYSALLGGFVVPASRLEEFAVAFERVCCGEREQPWTLNVTCAGEKPDDVRAIEEFQQGAVFIGSLETKAANPQAAQEVLERLPAARARYVEFAPERAAEILPVLGEYGARAKLRLGGETSESVPSVETVARFLLACARERVAWKATAGLHHAVRGVREIVPGGPRVKMHGFVNVFLAGGLAFVGADEATLVKTLAEEDPMAFRVDDDVLEWQDQMLISDQIERVRREFAISFGSCSFAEPVEDLRAMGWA
ncbi:MAG TPA: hypothetical protein VHZ09_19455 [Acidobacteriaceae bacterium]|jgi:hypothetical protein|nr:hypothetical protein [Acidobacteriaceae bacterium]